MNYNISTINRTVQGGVITRIEMEGNKIFLKRKSENFPIFVSLNSNDSDLVEMDISDAIIVKDKFHNFYIFSEVTQDIVLYVFSGNGVDFNSMRFSGEISGVVETAPDYSRVISEDSFCAIQSVDALTAKYSIAEFYNPVASNKNIFITTRSISSLNPNLIYQTGISDEQIAIDAAAQALNMKGGGRATVLRGNKIQANNFPSIIYGTVNHGEEGYYSGENLVQYDQPLMISPGFCFWIGCASVNETIYTSIKYFEETI